jgi:hypothetical protein
MPNELLKLTDSKLLEEIKTIGFYAVHNMEQLSELIN